MANGRNRSRLNQTFIPQFSYTGIGRNRRAVPMNAAAISQIVANNPDANPGLLNTNTSGGIIQNANAGASNPNNPIIYIIYSYTASIDSFTELIDYYLILKIFRLNYAR